MYPEKRRSKGIIMLVLGIVVVAVLVLLGSRSGSQIAPAANPIALDPQASSTLSQGVQLAKWLAKEYPPQAN